MDITRQCPHCGRSILDGALFCLDCGGRILRTASTAGGRRLSEARIMEPDSINDIGGLQSGSYLFVTEGLDRGHRFDLVDQKNFIIGRDEADICLHDPFVSRRHAEIRADGKRWLIFDFDSTNGALVNDLPVAGQELLDGDLIEVGYTTLIFRVKL